LGRGVSLRLTKRGEIERWEADRTPASEHWGGEIVDIQLADVTVHIDEALDSGRRAAIEEKLRAIDGVVSVHNPDDKPHLAVIEFMPNKISTRAILQMIEGEGVNAELIGL